MPGILDAGANKERQGGVEIGVVEHDLRRLAAQFEGDRHHVFGGGLLHLFADADRAGEGDMVDARMRRERRSGLFAEPRHHVQRAPGQPGLGGEIGEGEGGKAGLFRRFQHAGIAHGKRRAHRAADDLHRVVPRDDVAGHPVRLAQGVDGIAALVGDRLAHHLVGGPGVELHVARQGDGVVAGLGQRFADIMGLDHREVVDALGHELADPGKDAATFERRHLAPSACQRALCCGHGSVDIGGGAPGNGAYVRAGRGVFERQLPAARGRDPAAVDEAFRRVIPEPVKHVGLLAMRRESSASRR